MPTAEQLQVLCDKDEIRDVILRYARAVDRHDPELLATVYHEDALEHRGDTPMLGRDYVAFVFGPKMSGQYRLMRHHLTNILIEVDGDVARAETYFALMHRYEKDGREVELTQYGRFLDLFERRNGAWKIAKRWRVRDFARQDPVVEDPQPPAGWYMGQKSTSDHLYKVFAKEERTRS